MNVTDVYFVVLPGTMLMDLAGVGEPFRVAKRFGAQFRLQLEKDVYLLSETVAHFAAVIRQMAAENDNGDVTLADFRDRIGMGRRYAVQLLEFYDRIGLTRFIGDAHRVRDDARL